MLEGPDEVGRYSLSAIFSVRYRPSRAITLSVSVLLNSRCCRSV